MEAAAKKSDPKKTRVTAAQKQEAERNKNESLNKKRKRAWIALCSEG